MRKSYFFLLYYGMELGKKKKNNNKKSRAYVTQLTKKIRVILIGYYRYSRNRCLQFFDSFMWNCYNS